MAGCKGFTREGARGRIGKDPICGRCKRRKSEHGARPTKAAPAKAKAPRKPKAQPPRPGAKGRVTVKRLGRLKKAVAEKRRSIKRAGAVAQKIARMLERVGVALDQGYSGLRDAEVAMQVMLSSAAAAASHRLATTMARAEPAPLPTGEAERMAETVEELVQVTPWESSTGEQVPVTVVLEPSPSPVPPKAPELMMAAILPEDDSTVEDW